MFETKTVLGLTDFMLCDKCKVSQCRIKMSNEGFLFAACMGYPKCKNAIHTLTKNIRNIQMLDETCCKCATSDGSGPTVFKFKISIFSQGN